MELPYKIVCRRCFRVFNPYEVKFKCVFHDTPHIFRPEAFQINQQNKPRYDVAACPRDNLLCTFRICPICESDLPHYSGQVPGTVIAIVGSRTSGKTTYLVALLKHLIENAAADIPGFSLMFEDDKSNRWFQDLHQQMAVVKELPDPTLVSESKLDPDPVNIRLYGHGLFNKKRQASEMNFIVLYDPPGELFESFENTSFIRYVSSAAGIILTLDPEQLQRGAADLLHVPRALIDKTDPCNIINAIAGNIRSELGLSGSQRIKIPLVILLTKADAFVYPIEPRLRQPEQRTDNEPEREAKKRHLDSVHRCCQDLLHRWKRDDILDLVNQQFSSAAYFCCSAVDMSPGNGRFRFESVGVADPLLWIL